MLNVLFYKKKILILQVINDAQKRGSDFSQLPCIQILTINEIRNENLSAMWYPASRYRYFVQ